MLFRAIFASTLALAGGSAATQQLTTSPAGPFHVEGNRIIDSHGRPFLMRGTRLTPFHPGTMAHDNRSGRDFGEHSATSLSAIRLRFNMNTVRLSLDPADAARAGYFDKLATVVRRANDLDLLVVLAANASPDFWAQCAAKFRNWPNVMFDIGNPAAVQSLRSAGSDQPAIVWDRLAGSSDSNLILEAPATLGAAPGLGARAAERAVLAEGLDLDLDDPAACAAVPHDPAAASKLVDEALDYYDAHQISWTASEYRAGKLIKDLSLQDATSLENGWTCGPQSYPAAGLGRVVEAHLRSNRERGLFVVSAGGGPDVARGGFAIAYGPVMAGRDAQAPKGRLSASLGNIAVEITDSRGMTRRASLFYATAAWGQVNLVIPPESSIAPATMTIVRRDGSRESTQITIADTAPGFWTGVSCRGPAQGVATQTLPDGRTTSVQIQSCEPGNCWANAIPVSNGAVTRVRLRGSGFRYAGSRANIEVRASGVRLPVLAFGPSDQEPGVDDVTVEIPLSLRGKGVIDLICKVNGRVSNAVQINVGS